MKKLKTIVIILILTNMCISGFASENSNITKHSTIKLFLKDFSPSNEAKWLGCFEKVFETNTEKHSLINSYLLMYASFFTYDNVLAAPSFKIFKKRFSKIMAPLGIKRISFISVSDKYADTQVVIMSTDKIVIIAFRGSEMPIKGKSMVKLIYDWIFTDFNFFLRPFPEVGSKAEIHTGFYNATDIVYKKIKKAIRRHTDDSLAKNKTIWLTGHSLGGGLAPITAIKLIKDGIKVQGVHTFGAPRFANPFLAQFMSKRLRLERWVFNNDIVAKLPFKKFGFEHVSLPNNIYSSGKVVFKDAEMLGTANISSHFPISYLKNLFALLPENFKMILPPPPPEELWDAGNDEKFLQEFETFIDETSLR